MDDDTDVVVFSSKIQTLVKVSYPNVVKLINYNAPGLVQHLKATGAVKARKIDKRLKVKQSRTWLEHKDEIVKSLDKTNDDKRLDKAKVTIAKKIWDEHYKAYPDWPGLEKTQSETLDFSVSDLDDVGQYHVAWFCDVTVTVLDEHPEVGRYLTSLSGSFDLKVLYIHKTLTNNFEKEAVKDYEATKKKIDEYTKGKIEN